MSHRRQAGPSGKLPGLLLLAAGVLIAVGAPTVWSLTHADPVMVDIAEGSAVRLAESGPTVVTTDQMTAATSPTPTSAPTRSNSAKRSESPTVASSRTHTRGRSTVRTTATPALPAFGIPVRLSIPAIGINAPVEPVGVDDRGDMAIPEQVQQIGWYRFGAAPGATSGSIVMSGHVDSAQQGLGAFSRLGDLRAGDRVGVTDAAGHQLTYRVVSREMFDKSSVPLQDLFSRLGSPRLTLITCGGSFDRAALSYRDNVVVTAVPA